MEGSKRVGYHAEQLLIQELKRLGISNDKVLKIYSEFEPCNKGNNCAQALKEFFPNVKVYWSFNFNNLLPDAAIVVRNEEYDVLESFGVGFKETKVFNSK
jgi:hypothetical protein